MRTYSWSRELGCMVSEVAAHIQLSVQLCRVALEQNNISKLTTLHYSVHAVNSHEQFHPCGNKVVRVCR